jgi:hypothetical protein
VIVWRWIKIIFGLAAFMVALVLAIIILVVRKIDAATSED